MSENQGTQARTVTAPAPPAQPDVPRWLGLAMLAEAITFGFASYLHLDGRIQLGFATIKGENFHGAVVPEAVIGFVLAVAAGAVLTGMARSRGIAFGAIGFAIVGTAFGLSVVLRGSQPPADLVYHGIIMAVLVATFVTVLARRPVSGPAPGS